MRYYHERGALGTHVVYDGGDLGEGVDVQARVDLVEEDEVRFQEEHLQDLVPFLLSSGEPLVEVAGRHVGVQADLLVCVLGESVEVVGRDGFFAADVEARTEEVGCHDPRDVRGVLEGHEDAFSAPLVRGEGQEVLPVKFCGARRYAVFGGAHEDVQERGFAVSVGPQQCEAVPFLEGKTEIVQDLFSACFGGQVGYNELFHFQPLIGWHILGRHHYLGLP